MNIMSYKNYGAYVFHCQDNGIEHVASFIEYGKKTL